MGRFLSDELDFLQTLRIRRQFCGAGRDLIRRKNVGRDVGHLVNAEAARIALRHRRVNTIEQRVQAQTVPVIEKRFPG